MALKFITFEGGEGSGKSTQARLLADRLRASGHEVVVTREPGGSPLAEKIRDVILAAKPAEPQAEFLLFAAARAEHLTVTIKPALARGAFVICDRFIHSTRVYQGALGSIDDGFVAAMEQATVAPYFPTLTLMLDLPAVVGVARAVARGALNRFDQHNITWHRGLRQAFLDEAANGEPKQCRVIDANRSEPVVAADVWSMVARTFDLAAS